MQQFLQYSGYCEHDIASIVALNKLRAIGNPLAPYAGITSIEDVLNARPVCTPITESMIARHSDGAFSVVIAAEDAAIETARKPVYLTGTGWCSGNSVVERRDHAVSEGTALAARMAYQEAGVRSPTDELDLVYVSDLYAHRELMHLDAMQYSDDTLATINPDGGSLAMGDLLEANGGARLYDAVLQLRGEAGAHQVQGAKRIAVQAWRGLPTDSCAVAVLDAERRTS